MTDANDYSDLELFKQDDCCKDCEKATEHPPFHHGCRCYWIRVRMTCKKCGSEMKKVGQTLGQMRYPVFECSSCKEFKWDATMQGSILGVAVLGKFFKITEDGKMIPVAHPDDVWG